MVLGRYDEDPTDFKNAIKKWIETRGTYELATYELDNDNN